MPRVPELVVVMSPGQSWFVRELAETVSYELELQGIPCSLRTDGFPEPRPDRVYVLPAPREFVAVEGESALPDDSILKRTVFICADPAASVAAEEHLALLRRAGAVFAIDVGSVMSLQRAGIPARTLRPGYSTLRDRFDPEADRPIDVMFLATHSPRRTRLLNNYAAVLSRHNCLLQIADSAWPNSAGSSSFLAEGKHDQLERTKVVINLHQTDEQGFEMLRALEAMHCGAVVVSEHSSMMAPFVPGEHLLVAAPESVPFVAEAVLRDPSLQRRLREQAYERLSSWLPFAQSIAVLRAALVELVGHPVPSDASTGRSTVAQPNAAGRWDPVAETADSGLRSLERELRDTRLGMIQARRQISRLQRMIGRRDGTPALQLVHETPAWRARRTPRITAITTLCDDAGGIERTLDSLAASWLQDVELIVVDSGSSQDGLRAALAWLRARPRIPARLIARPDFMRGAARNAALAQARAPYCLMLDPGDELFPRALDVLIGTLDATPDAALAYPMLGVTGPVDSFVKAGGDSLLNFFGWEPGRLRLRSYVQSPYLVRSERLRELDGFGEDPCLLGWEVTTYAAASRNVAGVASSSRRSSAVTVRPCPRLSCRARCRPWAQVSCAGARPW